MFYFLIKKNSDGILDPTGLILPVKKISDVIGADDSADYDYSFSMRRDIFPNEKNSMLYYIIAPELGNALYSEAQSVKFIGVNSPHLIPTLKELGIYQRFSQILLILTVILSLNTLVMKKNRTMSTLPNWMYPMLLSAGINYVQKLCASMMKVIPLILFGEKKYI
ncbi:hypothetical protein [Xenorhabdus szentirmaii]|uniref:hypothetical protein n=1 Tax=Xenorhabdus szentirmaii TaxID=290112 RepID=UPI0019BF7CB4|nr:MULTISPECIES: hypothetical protein [unclassified Xenorhabdus]MBD2780395.1 hypothetical protein [Xenorhabdus sp. 38]MBD2792486.1 hypothetical protein [Xenorhabdus sp. CUL]MBD2805193.1 hypothetical protein [Xenorhabdus sp. ZM]